MARGLVALKVDPETRRRVRVLAAKRDVEMWELVRSLVDAEWVKDHPKDYPAASQNKRPSRDS